MTFADLIPALTGGKIDVIATEMAITPARAQQVDFSVPIYNAPREAVVVLASDTTAYRNLADLKNIPVGVQKGSIQFALLQRTGGFSQMKVYDTVKDVWAAVASGQVKAAVTPGTDTIYAAKQGELPNLRIVSSYQSPSPIPWVGIAGRKGNSELLGKINTSAKLEADGTLKRFSPSTVSMIGCPRNSALQGENKGDRCPANRSRRCTLTFVKSDLGIAPSYPSIRRIRK